MLALWRGWNTRVIKIKVPKSNITKNLYGEKWDWKFIWFGLINKPNEYVGEEYSLDLGDDGSIIEKTINPE